MSNGWRFLKQIDRETPEELDVHLIQDNYATHKHPKVEARLARHPRFKSHFTPTSSSCMNRSNASLPISTADVIRSGSFASIGEAAASKPISPIAMRPRNPTPGRPKAPQSSRKSTAPAPPSDKVEAA